MFKSRTRLLFGAALLLAAAISPATAGSQVNAKSQLTTEMMPTECWESGSVSRCCTSDGYCCTWSGGGSPICY
jgi:nitrous oxide reductase